MSLLAALLLALSATAAQAAPKQSDVAAYRALTVLDARLAAVGYRLAEANTPFCGSKTRNPGWVLHGIGQYEDSETAAAAFGFEHGSISIAAIVAGGPAAKAGLLVGDDLHSLPGSRWDSRKHVLPSATKEEAEQLRQTLRDMWSNASSIEISFQNDAGYKALNFSPPLVCASDFWVDTRSRLDAGADGERVRLTSAMMEYVADDQELAAVVAHELSHNLLAHRAQLNGVKRGKTKAVLATEIEADRLSVWLMANAGYEPQAALRFWERYGKQHGLGIFSDGTHLRWKNRVAIMQAEIDRMAKTKKTDGKLPPPLLVSK